MITKCMHTSFNRIFQPRCLTPGISISFCCRKHLLGNLGEPIMKTIPVLALAIAGLASTASAASRSSANYLVPADTVDAGGSRTASANYAIDASLGGIGGIGSAAAPDVLAKHSYVGQLFQVVGLSVTASPTNVNEIATRQLATFVVTTTPPAIPSPPPRWPGAW